ncbi:MAG: ferrous iron transport protein A [Acidaminococcales bacterium]|jgi:Fe2+ transport system protein FeoA|nr:ferrous iron transport protein A [Acidaminococcales bacterium]
MEKTLAQFKPGEMGRVSKVTGEGVIKRRLFDMGITPGTEIYLRKTAPLGDPLELRVRGYGLSIRRTEALSVLMLPGETN